MSEEQNFEITKSTNNRFALIFLRTQLFFTFIGEKCGLNALSLDDYKERLHKHIKDAFKEEIKLPHPCHYQKQECREESACPLLGLPENACVHFIRGKCKFSRSPNTCRYKHYEKYADIYRKAKQEFRSRELQPYRWIKNILKRFAPISISIGGIVASRIIRMMIEYFMKKTIF